MQDLVNKKPVKIAVTLVFCFAALFLILMLSETKADAKTIVIKTPKQMRNINWKNKGFGPGNTYKLGNDMTLTDNLDADEYPTVLLTKGKFVIDFNGHTLQNSGANYGVFSLRGADVTLKDSKKASFSRPSVRSYGAGAIDMTAGKLTVKNGYYLGKSDGTNNPAGLSVGGGKCVVNGGTFDGEFVGGSVSGGKVYINNAQFIGRYMFSFLHFGAGTIKITKGTFTNTWQSGNIPTFALGAFNNNSGKEYSFAPWLASGARFSPSFVTYYWKGTGNTGSTDFVSQYPVYNVGYSSFPYPYAVAYTGNSGFEPVTIKVSSSPAPEGTRITSLKSRSKGLSVKWKKKSKNTSGYQLQISTSSKFKNAKKINVKGKKSGSKIIKKLKSNKKYYVRVRTYRSFNGTKFYSKWSKSKNKITK